MAEIFRQGDFVFIPQDSVPKGKAVKREGGRIIVGRGEQTGHHHAVTMPKVKMIEGTDMRRYLVSDIPFVVTHEEHAAVALPPGAYEVRQQRQYLRGEIRRVAD